MPDILKTGIGLALSGGAARGIAHIGVLEVLERDGIPVRAIAGTSVGSVVGALYAAGMSLPEIKRILVKTKWSNILRPAIPTRGFISSEGICRLMEKILPVADFSSLVIPFAAVATDLKTAAKVDLTTGSIAKAVQASCSLPVLFTPTLIDGKFLIDGGVSSQIPVRTVREALRTNPVIAVNVNYRAPEAASFDNVVKIATHLSMLWASRNAREEEKLANVIISVNAKGISLYDLSKSEELLERGRQAAEDKLPEIRALIEQR